MYNNLEQRRQLQKIYMHVIKMILLPQLFITGKNASKSIHYSLMTYMKLYSSIIPLTNSIQWYWIKDECGCQPNKYIFSTIQFDQRHFIIQHIGYEIKWYKIVSVTMTVTYPKLTIGSLTMQTTTLSKHQKSKAKC